MMAAMAECPYLRTRIAVLVAATPTLLTLGPWGRLPGRDLVVLAACLVVQVTAPLLVPRRSAVLLAVATAAGIGCAALLQNSARGQSLVIVILAALTGAFSAPSAAAAAGLACGAAWVLTVSALPMSGGAPLSGQLAVLAGIAEAAVMIVVPLLLGMLFRASAEQSRLREEIERALSAERVSVAEQAVLAERQRMAQELHDIAAHHLTAVVMDAQALRRLPPGDDSLAEGLLAEIADQARQAQQSLRGAVGLAGGGAPTAPQPGLAEVKSLVGESSIPGRPILLRWGLTAETEESLQKPAQLAVYRIVQESLTNATRYASDGPVSVDLTETESAVELNISSPLRKSASSCCGGTGSGIAGLRQRAYALGGQLSAGSCSEEWIVRARIPKGGERRHDSRDDR